MKAKGCYVYLHGNTPGFTLPSNIGELGDDIVNLDLQQCSLQGITCRVAPTLRDGTESEISHTFPVPAMCRRNSRVDREPDEAGVAQPLQQSARRSVCAHRVLKPRYATEPNRRFLTRSPFPRCAGAIPESIGRLTNLELLDLSFNALTGA